MSIRSFFRLYCPRSCLEENPHISRVIGTGTYSDVSLTIHHQDHQRLKMNQHLLHHLSLLHTSVEVQHMPIRRPRGSNQE